MLSVIRCNVSLETARSTCHQIAPVMPHTRKDFPRQKMSQPPVIQTATTVVGASVTAQYSPPTRLTSEDFTAIVQHGYSQIAPSRVMLISSVNFATPPTELTVIGP
jgi:hypothetical protein